jgi:glycerate kinase
MAQALGYNLRDQDDRELPLGGLPLERLDWIDSHKVAEGLRYVEVVAACDVNNTLCGPNGSTRIYGPQKGATPEMVERLDAALRHFGEIVEADLDVKVLDVPGAGAAGGLAAGLVAFAHAELRPGFDLVSEAYNLPEQIRTADWVITGEGKLDHQSLHGKAPIRVAHLARDSETPCAAIVGTLGSDAATLRPEGLHAVYALARDGEPTEAAMREAEARIANAAETWAREHAAS